MKEKIIINLASKSATEKLNIEYITCYYELYKKEKVKIFQLYK
jgi:hypothetical protein